ncbi:segregation/condensation protein A [Carnobacteriaceae bacterium zg-ZUI252]|nr:segregation/condensation protein A [Carnobacteriaceae bacterium zg-ZUI252]MBS4770699.1 segregation/condensation protein A [Carnobacteriaceae bacterium zg-ZUI240]QTU82712.1 segregation/condensation protein A [Carnobacteriaceae bacterium zg-C25]
MGNQLELRITLDDFEGPLDLLLHLIKETKMSIEDVPMLLIVDQYLTFIRSMHILQLDVAGDYLVMAATLLEIKSRLLLPRVETVDTDDEYEEDENLEENLKLQLIEYKKFKDVAHVLKEKEDERGQFFSKEPSDLHHLNEVVPLQDGEVSLEDVVKAFQRMFEKQAQKQPLHAKIEMSKLTVEESMQTIINQLTTFESADLSDLVSDKDTLLATFLALLELTRTQQITFKQSTPYEPIKLFRGNLFGKVDHMQVTSGI